MINQINKLFFLFLINLLLFTNCDKKQEHQQSDYEVSVSVYRDINNTYQLDTTKYDESMNIRRFDDNEMSINILLNEISDTENYLINDVIIVNNDTNKSSCIYDRTFGDVISLLYKKNYPSPTCLNNIKKFVFSGRNKDNSYILYNDEYGMIGLKMKNFYLYKRKDIKTDDMNRLSDFIIKIVNDNEDANSVSSNMPSDTSL